MGRTVFGGSALFSSTSTFLTLQNHFSPKEDTENTMHGMTTFETLAIFGVLGIAVLGLAYAYFLRWQILKEDKGTQEMQAVWQDIKDGADAYLNRQLRTILPFIGILIVALFFSVWIVNPTPEALETFGDQARIYIAFGRSIAFAMGAPLIELLS